LEQAVSLIAETARESKDLSKSVTAWVEGSHRFAWALGGIVVIGIVARILFIVGWTWGAPLHGDPAFFQQTAAHIAQGKGYAQPLLGTGNLEPTAAHPPVFSALLAGLDFVHIRSVDAHRIALAFISAGGVLAMGLFGRRLAGSTVGLVAAGIAALDPLWVQWSGFVMSESIYLVIIPTMLLFALRCLDRPNRRSFAALGVLIGLATLTRSEAVDFVVLLSVPVVVLAASSWRNRLVFGLVLLAGVGLIVAPWLIRNDLKMGAPMLSTDGGTTLSGSYNSVTFSPSNPEYGGFDEGAFLFTAILVLAGPPPNHAQHWTERTGSGALSNIAKNYALTHLSDLPGVALAREGRAWGVYAPGAQLAFDVSEDGMGARGPKQLGQIMNWVLLPFACLGAFQLARRSRRRLAVVVVPIAVVAINAAVFYGSTRLRVAAEPSIDVLASIGAIWAGRRMMHRTTGESDSWTSAISN
jgi:4-amino-4-deoxy-L-arabinose transferase-like glycosyltransferase